MLYYTFISPCPEYSNITPTLHQPVKNIRTANPIRREKYSANKYLSNCNWQLKRIKYRTNANKVDV